MIICKGCGFEHNTFRGHMDGEYRFYCDSCFEQYIYWLKTKEED